MSQYVVRCYNAVKGERCHLCCDKPDAKGRIEALLTDGFMESEITVYNATPTKWRAEVSRRVYVNHVEIMDTE